jgi:hypothetical protein
MCSCLVFLRAGTVTVVLSGTSGGQKGAAGNHARDKKAFYGHTASVLMVTH